MKTKSYPVGQGNHNNVHFIIRGANYVFKLCAFPDTEKIYIMSSSCKDKDSFDVEEKLIRFKANFSQRWNYELIADANNLLNLRFDSTKDLLESDYYKKS